MNKRARLQQGASRAYRRRTSRTLLSAIGLIAISMCATGASALAQANQRYVRVDAAGAKILNFGDPQGLLVRKADGGELLQALSRNSAGFLEVSSAAGFDVWVFGQYLENTGVEGVLRATANVRMRPKPSSDPSSLPLTTLLLRDEQVRMIARNDKSKPMADDWVRIKAPASARGWVDERDTVEVADATAAAQEWKGIVAASRTGLKSIKDANKEKKEAAKAQQASMRKSQAAAAKLAEADTLHTGTKKDPNGANWQAVVGAYEAVMLICDEGSTHFSLARRGADEAGARLELALISGDYEKAKAERVLELARLERERERERLSKTPTWGRFQSRGWVLSKKIEGQVRYFVKWSGELVSEITCTSMRYDMSLFDGAELGIQGRIVRSAMPATEKMEASPQVIDVSRLEIISPGTRR